MNADTPLPPKQELAVRGLRLLPWQPMHAEALYEAVRESIASIGRWLPWCHAGYSRENAEAWIEHCQSSWAQGDAYVFGVFDSHGRVLGDVGLNRLDRINRRANMGYWVRTDAQGQGVASNAARAVAAFGFERLGLVRIEIVAALANQPSRRCAEKAGAHLEGTARQRLIVADTPVDAAIYSLIPADLAQPADAQSSAMS